jgi:putative transcriptional regulator
MLMARVTSSDFAERLLRSAQQAAEIKQGQRSAAKTSRHKVTSREVVVRQPPKYDAKRILRLRQKLGVSQSVFAGMLGVQPPTVRAWEQEQKEPGGSARRLLEIYEQRPTLAEATIERAEGT